MKWAAAAAVLIVGNTAAQPRADDEAALRSHLAYLASDAMEGREAGTTAYERAADYVVARFAAAGLLPAGTNGWLQPVPMLEVSATGPGTAAVARGAVPEQLTHPADYVATSGLAPDGAASGEVVFAGHCIVEPAHGLDDFRGLNVRGKLVACLAGGPASLSGEARAYHADPVTKANAARARGAQGSVLILFARADAGSFLRLARTWRAPRTVLADKAEAGDRQALPLAMISPSGAAKLFAGSRLDWSQVQAAAADGRPLPRGDSGARLTVRSPATSRRLSSSNVVGLIPGADPKLRREFIVVSAHLDGLGMRSTPAFGDPDRIANGALDNAVGVAAMIELATAFRRSGKPPRRSVLFVAFTGEEKGLLGSTWFVRHPPAPGMRIVAAVNLDMPVLTYAFQDVVAIGGERSSIGPAAAAAAAAHGVASVPDPQPERGAFLRSDQFSFAKAGVPSVLLQTGPGGPGAEAWNAYMGNHYHRPSDDLSLAIDWSAARKFVLIAHHLIRTLADDELRPCWKSGGRGSFPPPLPSKAEKASLAAGKECVARWERRSEPRKP